MKYLFLIATLVTSVDLAIASCNPCICHIPRPPECSAEYRVPAESNKVTEPKVLPVPTRNSQIQYSTQQNF